MLLSCKESYESNKHAAGGGLAILAFTAFSLIASAPTAQAVSVDDKYSTTRIGRGDYATVLDDKGNIWHWGDTASALSPSARVWDETRRPVLTEGLKQLDLVEKQQGHVYYALDSNGKFVTYQGYDWKSGSSADVPALTGTYTHFAVYEDGLYGLTANGIIEFASSSSKFTMSLPEGKKIVAFDTAKNFYNYTQTASTNASFVDALADDGSVYEFTILKATQISPTKYTATKPVLKTLPEGVTAVSISAGALIDNQGRAWTWNATESNTSNYGPTQPQLVTPPNGVKFKKIDSTTEAGPDPSKKDYRTYAAIDTDGQVWTWGYGGSGALGDGSKARSDSSTPLKTTFPSGIKIIEITGVTGLSSGETGGFRALDDQNRLWSWGLGNSALNNTLYIGDGGITINDYGTPHSSLRLGASYSESDMNNCVAQMPTTGAPTGLASSGLAAVSVLLAGLLVSAGLRRRWPNS